jgi:hypothetical protein
MNVVIFGKGFGRPRQVNLSGRSAAVYAFLITGFLATLAFAGGYLFSAHTGSGVSFNAVASLCSANKSRGPGNKPKILSMPCRSASDK